MTEWLYRIVPARPEMVTAPTQEERDTSTAHFEYLVDLRDRGILILAGRTQEAGDAFGIVIFEADDENEARAVMDGDPGVSGGVFAATLHPYAVAVARAGLVD
ncbi:YciI family protein [Microbacterium sp. CPCC 204701]|uniref:YciI family protein n=1 Tax=Microbacterium sp. CPCC 204701 TaxID=2493084 RepID=UPI000FDA014E|nr:YciI family protein [Microbacterium sp. CPCC 204701]